jgi:AraC family transcriptional regulator, regulatory protein of adaptative response / DNA-3-methyladenine glycosylase II
LQPDICYRALKAHDRRFDGIFFTCVTSTKIYCRPICPAAVPRQENCRFVATSIEAEKAGFRPCLRCRPELAPSVSRMDAALPAHRLAEYIDETLLMDETLADAVRQSDLGERQLRRIFVQTFGVESKQYVTSRRLLFAKQLLQDTRLSITDIAFSAGFSSRGRLTINMQQTYGLTPEKIRQGMSSYKHTSVMLLRADYRPPFQWDAVLTFLKGRATPSEWVADGAYHRIVDGHELIVKNVPAKSHLTVQIPIELARQSHALLGKVRRLFDLDANPVVIAESLSQDIMLARLITTNPGLRVPGCWDNFEMLLRVIVGQQVSVAGATTIMRRLVERIGTTPTAIIASSPAAIATIGMPLRRATTIWDIAIAVDGGLLNLEEKDVQLFYDQLVAIPGIGPWTAEYMRMRVLRWPDAFPAGDLGLQKAVIPGGRLTEKQLTLRAEAWRPWRSYATMLLWKSLENKGG